MTQDSIKTYLDKTEARRKVYRGSFGFAPFFGEETEQYAVSPFSGCKEYPLDSYQAYYRKNKEILPKTGVLISGFKEERLEKVKETILYAEKFLGFSKTSFHYFKEHETLSAVGSTSWHANPAMLSFYLALIRLSHNSNSVIKIDDRESFANSNAFDANSLKSRNFNLFAKLVRGRKFKQSDARDRFVNSTYKIHGVGIQNFLSDPRNLEKPQEYFSERGIKANIW